MPTYADGVRMTVMIQQAGKAWDVLQSRVRGPVCEWPAHAPVVPPKLVVR